MTEVLLGAGTVGLAVVLHAQLNDGDMDLGSKTARLLVENAALVRLGRERARSRTCRTVRGGVIRGTVTRLV